MYTATEPTKFVPLPLHFRKAATAFGTAAVLLGFLGLFAWLTGMRVLSSIRASYLPMSPDTAIIFVLLGSCLILTTNVNLSSRLVRAQVLLVVFASFYGLLKFAEYVVKLDFTFESYLFPIVNTIGAYPINRMSPISGILFLVSGCAILSVIWRQHSNLTAHLAGGLGLTVFVAGFVGTTGYLFASPLLYGGDIIPVAATTALAFLLLGTGIMLASGPSDLFLRQLVGSSVQARMLRAFLPLTAAVVLVQGFLNQVLPDLFELNHALFSAVLSLVVVVITAFVVSHSARNISRAIDQADSERKQAEGHLRQERNLLRTIIDNVPDQIFAKDGESTFILCNTGYARLKGVEPASVLGKTDRDFSTSELAERYRTEDREVIHSGSIIQDHEELSVDSAGSERWLSTTKVPLRNSRGEIVGVVGVKRDITERKQVEENLRLYAKIFENTAEGIMITDEKARIVSVNSSFTEITGHTADRAIGNTPGLFQPAGQDPDSYSLMWQSLRETGKWKGEIGSRRPDGDDYQVWATLNGVKNESGILTHYVCVFTDITERKREEEALARRNRELGLINRTGQVLNSTLNLDQVLVRFLDELDQLLEGAGTFWLIDPQTGGLVCRQASGPHATTVRGWRLEPGQGIAGWVAQTGKSLVVPDASTDERHSKVVDQQTGMEVRSILAVPLKSKQQVIGVLELTDTQLNCFSEADLALVESLASTAAIAIENARLFEDANELRKFNENIIQSMEEGILIEDEKGVVTFVNPSFAKLLHYECQELIGRHWSSLIAPDQVAAVDQETSGRRKGVKGRYEVLLINKENQSVPVIVSARPIFENGEFKGDLAVFTDITTRKRNEEELKESEQRYKELFATARRQSQELSLLDRVRNAISRELDLPLIFKTVVQAISEVFGYSHVCIYLLEEGELVLQHQLGYNQVIERIPRTKGVSGRVVQTGQPVLLPDVRVDQDFLGAIDGIASEVCVPLFDRGKVVGILNVESTHGVRLGVDDLRLIRMLGEHIGLAIGQARLYGEVQRLAITDALTGALNRRHFFELGEAEFRRSSRLGHPLCAIMLDIDHFKQVNDQFGHAVGDHVLHDLVDRFRKNLREGDVLGRYGGEEFAILLPKTDLESATQIAERLRLVVSETPFDTRRNSIAVTLSLGVAMCSRNTADLSALLDAADRGMYSSKHSGRNRVTFEDQDLQPALDHDPSP